MCETTWTSRAKGRERGEESEERGEKARGKRETDDGDDRSKCQSGEYVAGIVRPDVYAGERKKQRRERRDDPEPDGDKAQPGGDGSRDERMVAHE